MKQIAARINWNGGRKLRLLAVEALHNLAPPPRKGLVNNGMENKFPLQSAFWGHYRIWDSAVKLEKGPCSIFFSMTSILPKIWRNRWPISGTPKAPRPSPAKRGVPLGARMS